MIVSCFKLLLWQQFASQKIAVKKTFHGTYSKVFLPVFLQTSFCAWTLFLTHESPTRTLLGASPTVEQCQIATSVRLNQCEECSQRRFLAGATHALLYCGYADPVSLLLVTSVRLFLREKNISST